jgi:hypothetical protein
MRAWSESEPEKAEAFLDSRGMLTPVLNMAEA